LFTNGESAQIVETMSELIKQSLQDGEDILVSSFGKFCVKEKLLIGLNGASGTDERNLIARYLLAEGRKRCDENREFAIIAFQEATARDKALADEAKAEAIAEGMCPSIQQKW
jgi:hypothetical protein